MYYDLCLNYENQGNLSKELWGNLCELLTSAICDNYKIFAINTKRKGNVSSNDTCKLKEFNIKQIFQTNSLKFLNSSNIDTNFIEWDNIKILSRLTVFVNDSKDIYQFSNPNNALKSYDILAVSPLNEKMFDQCLSDLNVDIISLNFEEKINFSVKKHSIQSAIDRATFFEILYSDFIKDNTKRGIFIANLLMLFEVTKGRNIIISSGGETYYEQRSPYDIITIFETIFGLDNYTIKKMISENCEKVLLKSVQRKYFKTVLNLEVATKSEIIEQIQQESNKTDNKMEVEFFK
jgi:RNase P/RNase MRP subunit p30